MAKTERRYKGSLTLGKLELVLESQEALFGELTALEAVGGQTVGSYDDEDYPALSSLALLPTIGGTAPPPPANTKHLFDGEATIMGQTFGVAVFRRI